LKVGQGIPVPLVIWIHLEIVPTNDNKAYRVSSPSMQTSW
jgi:hypothetical protein